MEKMKNNSAHNEVLISEYSNYKIRKRIIKREMDMGKHTNEGESKRTPHIVLLAAIWPPLSTLVWSS
jgi:hypothetical protein